MQRATSTVLVLHPVKLEVQHYAESQELRLPDRPLRAAGEASGYVGAG